MVFLHRNQNFHSSNLRWCWITHISFVTRGCPLNWWCDPIPRSASQAITWVRAWATAPLATVSQHARLPVMAAFIWHPYILPLPDWVSCSHRLHADTSSSFYHRSSVSVGTYPTSYRWQKSQVPIVLSPNEDFITYLIRVSEYTNLSPGTKWQTLHKHTINLHLHAV